MDADSVNLYMLTIEDESFLCIKNERTDTDRCVVGIDNLIVHFDNALYLVEIRIFDAP